MARLVSTAWARRGVGAIRLNGMATSRPWHDSSPRNVRVAASARLGSTEWPRLVRAFACRFYGKRKSNFYGKDDAMKATGAANEEYDGPVGGGYFRRDGEGRPVSRKGARLGKGE